MTALALTASPIFPTPPALPRIIQGGMGVAVSSWKLASAVARSGQLGLVSGTALDLVLARRLQDGDHDGAARRALAAFPIPRFAERVLKRFFLPAGRAPGQPYAPVPRLTLKQTRLAQELTVLGNFVEVWLAKAGHAGLVGINYLEKIQMATPAASYGAMLAGADYVVMGAGIPREIPHLLDQLAQHEDVSLPITVIGGSGHTVDFSPTDLMGTAAARGDNAAQPAPAQPPLKRPTFLAIVSAHALAEYLARDPRVRPDGFVIEGHVAGGHNAPPRGRLTLDDSGQPIFGPRDSADVSKVAALGLPFWLAGAYGTPEAVSAALAEGAAGVQVGTLFALAQESGLEPALRDDVNDRLRSGTLEVRTDPLASPTGFPFKVAQVPNTLSDPAVTQARPRLCDLGYLRSAVERADRSVVYRCPAEPVHMYVKKGGDIADTVGRSCLCNSLAANVGLGQTRRDGYEEPALVTLGVDLDGVTRLAAQHPHGWGAEQAVSWLLGKTVG